MGAGQQTVELDEDRGGRDDEGRTDEPGGVRVRRRRWPWALLAVVLVVGGLAVAQHVLDDRHAAHEARFEHVPGVIAPLTSDPRRLWRLWTADDDDDWSTTRVGDVLVQSSTHDDDSTVRGLDPATGTLLWRTSVPPASTDPDYAPSLWCTTDHARIASTTRVVCYHQVVDGTSDIVVLDARTGRELVRRTTTLPWAVLGDQLVVAAHSGTDEHSTWTITATDADGSTAWERTVEWTPVRAEPDPDDGDGDAEDADATAPVTPEVSIDTRVGHLLLQAEGHAVVLDADGEVVQQADGDADTLWSLYRTGTLGTRDELDTLEVDDGSAPDVMFTYVQGRGLVARDGRTGRELWHESTVDEPRILLGGRLYTTAGSYVVALDALTGERVWNVHTDASQSVEATDGHVLYTSHAVEYASDDSGVLATFALDDGAAGPVWSTTGLGERPHAFEQSTGVLTITSDDATFVVG